MQKRSNLRFEKLEERHLLTPFLYGNDVKIELWQTLDGNPIANFFSETVTVGNGIEHQWGDLTFDLDDHGITIQSNLNHYFFTLPAKLIVSDVGGTISDFGDISVIGSNSTGASILDNDRAEIDFGGGIDYPWFADSKVRATLCRTDSDDQISEAINVFQINGSKSRNGEIECPSDVDTFKFSVRNNQEVAFDVDTVSNGKPGLNTYIRVFNEDGEQLGRNHNAPAPDELESGFDAYLKYQFKKGGTYYVSVSNWKNTEYNVKTGSNDAGVLNWGTGKYKLTISDPDDQIAEADPLGVIKDEVVTGGSIIQPKDVNMYSFQVSAHQRLAFDIDTLGLTFAVRDARLRIFDVNGKQLRGAYKNKAPRESGIPFENYLEFTFMESGKYYVGVSAGANNNYDPTEGINDKGGLTGIYKLTVTPLTRDISVAAGNKTLSGRVRLANPFGHIAIPVNLSVSNSAADSSINSNQRTWIISHGRGDDPSRFQDLARQVERQRPGDQVLLLNWKRGANDNNLHHPLSGAAWIPSVAHWVKGALEQLNISAKQTFLIGHSWGTYVSYEIGKVIGEKVGGLVALDPAQKAQGYPYRKVNFNRVSENSWAIFGGGSFGSADLSRTAEFAVSLRYDGELFDPYKTHFAPVPVFEDLLRGNDAISAQFNLRYLINDRNQPFKMLENRFSNLPTTLEPARRVFEGTLLIGEQNGRFEDALNFRYFDLNGTEMTVSKGQRLPQ